MDTDGGGKISRISKGALWSDTDKEARCDRGVVPGCDADAAGQAGESQAAARCEPEDKGGSEAVKQFGMALCLVRESRNSKEWCLRWCELGRRSIISNLFNYLLDTSFNIDKGTHHMGLVRVSHFTEVHIAGSKLILPLENVTIIWGGSLGCP